VCAKATGEEISRFIKDIQELPSFHSSRTFFLNELDVGVIEVNSTATKIHDVHSVVNVI